MARGSVLNVCRGERRCMENRASGGKSAAEEGRRRYGRPKTRFGGVVGATGVQAWRGRSSALSSVSLTRPTKRVRSQSLRFRLSRLVSPTGPRVTVLSSPSHSVLSPRLLEGSSQLASRSLTRNGKRASPVSKIARALDSARQPERPFGRQL